MEYDVIFVTGEIYFDHPFCGVAILKRLLEKYGYSVAVIENPKTDFEIKKYGSPKLFFGVTSGSIDSMVRNYTPLKKKRSEDKYADYTEDVPDRAVLYYCNLIKKNFKGVKIVLGGTESSLRRFVHYDYWSNAIRKPILLDSRADILVYGNGEKQILEICNRIKNNKDIFGIPGTCIASTSLPSEFTLLPDYASVLKSKERFCDMQMLLSNNSNLAQKIDNRFILQFKYPVYSPFDLDEYYELPFSRDVPKHLRGFQFSVVTHRGCIGQCNFCSLSLIQGNRIVSRSEESILREISKITKHPFFKGNIDDIGGPSSNMYGLDCDKCTRNCLLCNNLDRKNLRYLGLLKKARAVKGVKNVFIRSGIRYDLTSKELLDEIASFHIYETLRIAPEHVDKNVLALMNKNYGDLDKFIKEFKETNTNKELSFYFMISHPGCGVKETKELSNYVKKLKNAECFQVFIPTPMTVSTCMYYTGLDPKTKKKVYVPYTFKEKKIQKRELISS